MDKELISLRVAIRLLKESAGKLNQENHSDISRMIWFTIHSIWVEIIKITDQNEKRGLEAREGAILSAIKAGREDIAKNLLASLVLEKNIDVEQFHILKEHFSQKI